MTPEQLLAIRKRFEGYRHVRAPSLYEDYARADIPALLDEVERLTAELAVASNHLWTCPECGRSFTVNFGPVAHFHMKP